MNMFECVIQKEAEARTYYDNLAANTNVPELKNLFTMLAAAEQEHHDALVTMQENVDSPMSRFVALQEAACLFKPLLTMRDQIAELTVDTDAYIRVIQEEEDGAKFYEELAAREPDQRTREILIMIAAEERKHLNIVENIYSFVESPKNFLAWGEFSNLKEF
jgi:rubrerythrin